MESLGNKTPSQNPRTNQLHSFISTKTKGTPISTPGSSHPLFEFNKKLHPLQLSSLNDENISKKENEFGIPYKKLPNFKKKTLPLYDIEENRNETKLTPKKSFVLTLQNKKSVEIIDLDDIGQETKHEPALKTARSIEYIQRTIPKYPQPSDDRNTTLGNDIRKKSMPSLKPDPDQFGGWKRNFEQPLRNTQASGEFIDLTRSYSNNNSRQVQNPYLPYRGQNHSQYTNSSKSRPINLGNFYPEQQRKEYKQPNYQQQLFAIPGKSKSAHEFKDFNAYAPTPFQRTTPAPSDDDLFKNYESDLTKLEMITPPSELKGTPREHQAVGLNWLVDREKGVNKGGIVADEMGLGI
jgi:SNF2 family DNA or RNA helicase